MIHLPEQVDWMDINASNEQFATYPLDILTLYPSELVPPLPKKYIMKQHEHRCGSCALYAFNKTRGLTSEPSLPELIHHLSRDYPIQMYEKPKEGVSHSGMFVNAQDRKTPGMIYFTSPNSPPPAKLNPQWFSKKLLLIVYHPVFYQDKHCLVIFPPHDDLPNVWCIRDPFRKDGTGVGINQVKLACLLLYAECIFW